MSVFRSIPVFFVLYVGISPAFTIYQYLFVLRFHNSPACTIFLEKCDLLFQEVVNRSSNNGFIEKTISRSFTNFASKFKDLSRIIAIDYGTKRTGIAVTDPGQMIASPMETVATHELMVFLEAYFGKEEVETLVVGYPTRTDGSESESMRPLRFFVQAFKKRFPKIGVEWMDERYTSKMAVDAMVTGGMKKSKRRVKGNIDKISASLILQSWMERLNNLKR